MRKPRDLSSGFWEGHAQWTDWNKQTELLVNVHLGAATPAELRRMAAWMLRAAKYAEWAKRKKRTVQEGKDD